MSGRSTQRPGEETLGGQDELRKKASKGDPDRPERRVRSLVNENVRAPASGPWDVTPLAPAREPGADAEEESELTVSAPRGERDPDANVVEPEERDHREKPVPDREAPDVGDQQEISPEVEEAPDAPENDRGAEP